MDPQEAQDLLRPAVPPGGRAWADLGAGAGTFTRALAQLLGPGARIHAMDRDPRAVAALERLARQVPNVKPWRADFSREAGPPAGERELLDGILLANSLHFVADAPVALARLSRWLRPGGRVVLVEYDRRPASRWVPHPIPAVSWPALAAAAGLSRPEIVARKRSAFGGDLYVAIAERSGRGLDPLSGART